MTPVNYRSSNHLELLRAHMALLVVKSPSAEEVQCVTLRAHMALLVVKSPSAEEVQCVTLTQWLELKVTSGRRNSGDMVLPCRNDDPTSWDILESIMYLEVYILLPDIIQHNQIFSIFKCLLYFL